MLPSVLFSLLSVPCFLALCSVLCVLWSCQLSGSRRRSFAGGRGRAAAAAAGQAGRTAGFLPGDDGSDGVASPLEQVTGHEYIAGASAGKVESGWLRGRRELTCYLLPTLARSADQQGAASALRTKTDRESRQRGINAHRLHCPYAPSGHHNPSATQTVHAVSILVHLRAWLLLLPPGVTHAVSYRHGSPLGRPIPASSPAPQFRTVG